MSGGAARHRVYAPSGEGLLPMRSILLDFAYALFLLCVSPWVVYRILRQGRYRGGWSERFGHVHPREGQRPCVWLHAVSVGEVNAAGTLIEGLIRTLPGFEIVFTSSTDTGLAQARKLYGDRFRVFYFPLDFSFAIRRSLRRIRPRLCVLMEGEVWPNFTAVAQEEGVPVVVVNGRVGPGKGWPRYRRIGPLVRPMFRRVSLVLAQDPVHADRFVALGVPGDRVRVAGSLKYDTAVISEAATGADELARRLGLDASRRLWVAGSTGPGEERLLLGCFRTLSRTPGLERVRLVLVPRKPERFDEVARLVESEGLPLLRYSRIKADGDKPSPDDDRSVILGDTMGDLRRFYSLAEVVFIGRSLIPMGGSDMIEAVALAKPVVVGPHTENFAETVRLLKEGDGLEVADDAEGLASITRRLFEDSQRATALGRNGRRVIVAQQGATQRTVAAIVEFLGGQEDRRTGGQEGKGGPGWSGRDRKDGTDSRFILPDSSLSSILLILLPLPILLILLSPCTPVLLTLLSSSPSCPPLPPPGQPGFEFLQPPLEGGDAPQHLGGPLLRHQHTPLAVVIDGGKARDDSVGPDRLGDSGAGPDGDVVADDDVSVDACGGADAHPIADRRAPGDSGHPGDGAVFADHHVVGDLHQIVDLRSPADPGRPKRAPVDGRVATHLHVVAKNNPPGLGNLVPSSLDRHVSETIAADTGARVNDASSAYLGILPDHHVGIHHRPGADPTSGTDVNSGVQDHVVAHEGAGFYADQGTHGETAPQYGVVGDARGGMNSLGRMRRRGRKPLQHKEKGSVGLVHEDRGERGVGHGNRHQRRRSARFPQLREIFRTPGEGQLSRPRLVQTADAGDANRRIPIQHAADQFGNLSHRQFHAKTTSPPRWPGSLPASPYTAAAASAEDRALGSCTAILLKRRRPQPAPKQKR
jgi:3-deoxy-D-manno-octulosonic-acid transferase